MCEWKDKNMFEPTYIIRKNGSYEEIKGYGEYGTTTNYVTTWFDSRLVTLKESHRAYLRSLEGL